MIKYDLENIYIKKKKRKENIYIRKRK